MGGDVIQDRTIPKTWTILALLAATASLVGLAHTGSSLPGDVAVITFAQSLHNPLTTKMMEGLAFIGQPASLYAMGITGAGTLLVRRKKECYALVGAMGLMALNPLFKALADRERPPEELISTTQVFHGNGFPSGHTYMSVIFFGILIYLATVLIPYRWVRRSVQAVLAAVILSMGASRVYLGAHWPTDVIAAYIIGGLFLLAFIHYFHRHVLVPQSE